MRFEITKGERETNQSLVRRFTKRLRNSGVVRQAKRSIFRQRPKSEQTQKRMALRRLEKRASADRLKKLGL